MILSDVQDPNHFLLSGLLFHVSFWWWCTGLLRCLPKLELVQPSCVTKEWLVRMYHSITMLCRIVLTACHTAFFWHTRQIIPATGNHHATPLIESRKKSQSDYLIQSVNPYYSIHPSNWWFGARCEAIQFGYHHLSIRPIALNGEAPIGFQPSQDQWFIWSKHGSGDNKSIRMSFFVVFHFQGFYIIYPYQWPTYDNKTISFPITLANAGSSQESNHGNPSTPPQDFWPWYHIHDWSSLTKAK